MLQYTPYTTLHEAAACTLTTLHYTTQYYTTLTHIKLCYTTVTSLRLDDARSAQHAAVEPRARSVDRTASYEQLTPRPVPGKRVHRHQLRSVNEAEHLSQQGGAYHTRAQLTWVGPPWAQIMQVLAKAHGVSVGGQGIVMWRQELRQMCRKSAETVQGCWKGWNKRGAALLGVWSQSQRSSGRSQRFPQAIKT